MRCEADLERVPAWCRLMALEMRRAGLTGARAPNEVGTVMRGIAASRWRSGRESPAVDLTSRERPFDEPLVRAVLESSGLSAREVATALLLVELLPLRPPPQIGSLPERVAMWFAVVVLVTVTFAALGHLGSGVLQVPGVSTGLVPVAAHGALVTMPAVVLAALLWRRGLRRAAEAALMARCAALAGALLDEMRARGGPVLISLTRRLASGFMAAGLLVGFVGVVLATSAAFASWVVFPTPWWLRVEQAVFVALLFVGLPVAALWIVRLWLGTPRRQWALAILVMRRLRRVVPEA